MFWAARGTPASGAQELIDHRRARVIPITDADSFFRGLQQRVETLEQSQCQNPVGIELLVSSAKRFLSKPEHRIQLDELFLQEVQSVLARLDSPELSAPPNWDTATFRLYVKRYEAALEALACMAGVVGRWGHDTELAIVLDVVRTLYAHADKVGGGLVSYLGMRSYPAVLVFTACGLGLTRAERWDALHRLFDAVIARENREPIRAVESLFLWAWKGDEGESWKQIEGLERRKTALSDYLLTLFTEWSKRFIGLTPDFSLLFERFEMLGSLAHLERYQKDQVQQDLAGPTNSSWAFMPVGRTGWNESNAAKLVPELQSEPMKTALIQAGFAKNDPEFIDLFIQNFRRIAGRMRWS
jgi:hypothetical protein